MNKRITIALPVWNEERILEQSVRTLHEFLLKNLNDEEWRIVIADNGSTDRTGKISAALAQTLPHISSTSCAKGKGMAIQEAWKQFPADFYAFMDIDLATDLEAFPRLLAALREGSDLAYGSRFDRRSKVWYGNPRKFFSFMYRLLFRTLLHSSIDDPACGFKGVNERIVTSVLPRVEDTTWFFDSELAARAEHQGYKATPIPVNWVEKRVPKRQSKVPLSLSVTYLFALLKLRRKLV
jgi:glycosyltransferase involved in cell wall biosynthesis